MRFLLVTGIYPKAAERLRQQHFGGSQRAYADYYRVYAEAAFGISDRYAVHLAAQGWETMAVFGNDRFLQNCWAEERGLQSNSSSWWLDILCEQIREFQAEAVMLLDLYRFDREAREEIRRRCPSLRWVVGWRAAPVQEGEDFRDLDLFLSSLKSLVVAMREQGIASERLGAGFDESLWDRLSDTPRDLPFTFCGSIGKAEGMHSRRRHLIEEVFARTPLQIWSESSQDLRPLCAPGWLRQWRERKRLQPAVFGMDMYRILGRSRITLNVHIDMAGGEAVNMRLYEATGMGACLLTDNPDTIGEFFEPDEEVVTYRDTAELVDKVKYLMGHPGEAEAIAARGRRRTERAHTLALRSRELRGILEKQLLQA